MICAVLKKAKAKMSDLSCAARGPCYTVFRPEFDRLSVSDVYERLVFQEKKRFSRIIFVLKAANINSFSGRNDNITVAYYCGNYYFSAVIIRCRFIVSYLGIFNVIFKFIWWWYFRKYFQQSNIL